MKEFKVSEIGEPVPFKIGDDVFHAIAPNKLPGNVQVRYTETVMSGMLYQAHARFFQDALDEDSHKRFTERLDSYENPITLPVMADVANWLIGEVYGGKATDESKL